MKAETRETVKKRLHESKDKRNVKETAFMKAETRETLKKRHSWKQKQERR